MDGSFRPRLRRRREAAVAKNGRTARNDMLAGPLPRRRLSLRRRSGVGARPRRGVWSRPSLWVGVALVLVAVLGYWSVYAHAGRRTPVLVAAHTLPAGSVLAAADLRVARIGGDRALLAALVTRSQLGRVLGRRLAVAVPAGTPLAAAALAGETATPASITLAVPVLHALAGALVPGDRVTVLATFEDSSGHAQTRAVARGLLVLAVGRPPAGLDPTSAMIPVTVAADPAQASALALACATGKLDLLRDGARTQTAPLPPASEAAP